MNITVAPFVQKTFTFVSDPRYDSVTWTNNGESFAITNPEKFQKQVLPRYFKHANISSFVRQLNTYGFKKAYPESYEFAHPFFLQGRKDLLPTVRRKPRGKSTSSNLGSNNMLNLLDSLVKRQNQSHQLLTTLSHEIADAKEDILEISAKICGKRNIREVCGMLPNAKHPCSLNYILQDYVCLNNQNTLSYDGELEEFEM
mmetsp:Transcript_37801/g.58544  ORF Transcript_37801/g.58544 Transcript_37801/m.58544 type:complete len:200 (+) Transcript_37801:1-600(+)